MVTRLGRPHVSQCPSRSGSNQSDLRYFRHRDELGWRVFHQGPNSLDGCRVPPPTFDPGKKRAAGFHECVFRFCSDAARLRAGDVGRERNRRGRVGQYRARERSDAGGQSVRFGRDRKSDRGRRFPRVPIFHLHRSVRQQRRGRENPKRCFHLPQRIDKSSRRRDRSGRARQPRHQQCRHRVRHHHHAVETTTAGGHEPSRARHRADGDGGRTADSVSGQSGQRRLDRKHDVRMGTDRGCRHELVVAESAPPDVRR